MICVDGGGILIIPEVTVCFPAHPLDLKLVPSNSNDSGSENEEIMNKNNDIKGNKGTAE
jgi:hypothetical protein